LQAYGGNTTASSAIICEFLRRASPCSWQRRDEVTNTEREKVVGRYRGEGRGERGRLIIRRGEGKERGRKLRGGRRSTTLPMDQTNSPFYQRITKKACYLFNTIIQTNKKLQHPAREVSLLF